jgi:uncharacterized repeat protein (TIGR02543 family)
MKNLKCFLLAVLWCIATSAMAECALSSNALRLKPGETGWLEITLNSDVEINGAEFKVSLPDGLKFVSDDEGEPIYKTEYSDDAYPNLNSDQQCTVAFLNLRGKTIFKAGNSVIIAFNVEALKDAALTKTSSAKLFDIVLAEEEIDHEQDDYNSNVTIYRSYVITSTTADADKGTVAGIGDEEIEEGEDVKMTATPVAGYKFVNWTVDGEEVSTENPYVFASEKNVKVVANFTEDTFDVTFDVDGVTNVTPLTFKSTIPTPTSPTKTGYTFTGWDPAFEEGATVPAKDVTYTAQWKVNQYTITFDSKGGSDVAAITQDYGTAVTAPEDPTREGYTFTSWSKEVPATIPAENVTLEAVWKINQYTLSFDSDGGSEVAPITQDYGTEVTAPAAPTKTGYTFIGWSPEVPTTIPAKDVTYTAQWKVNQYTITFDSEGGSEVAAITQDYGTTVTAPANPTKEGYSFEGWSEDVPSTIPAKDVTIEATWRVLQYEVAFMDAENNNMYSDEALDYGTVITAPEDPTRVGYDFDGWDPEFVEGTTVPAKTLVYTAQWKIQSYEFTFNLTDEKTETKSFEYNTNVKALVNDPEREGYTFDGWDPVLPENATESGTYNAQWTVNSYTVTLVNGEETVDTYTINYGESIPTEKFPDYDRNEGLVFQGWAADEEYTTMPAHDVTYNAVWTANRPYIFTYDTNGAYPGTWTEELDYGTAVEAPELTRTGYTFLGWDPEIPEKVPAQDMTFVAQWQINNHNIAFEVDGEIVNEGSYDYGDVIDGPANPSKLGYTFTGWSPAYTQGDTTPDEDVTFVAQWQVMQFSIRFKTGGGTEIPTIYQDYGTPVEAPADPTREGYTFVGWDKEIPSVMPAYYTTVTALWEPIIPVGIANVLADCGGTADVYSLSGKLLLKSADAVRISQLSSGIYIINGKKIYVK